MLLATVVGSGAGDRALNVLVVAGYALGALVALLVLAAIGFLVIALLSEEVTQVVLLVACPVLAIAGYIANLPPLYAAAAVSFGLAALGAVLDL